MQTELLYSFPLYLILLLALVVSGATVIVGYRRGRSAPNVVAIESLLELTPASLLGLLALLLGFTFSMSVARFDNRKNVMVREANAIETSWLRAGLLPGDQVPLARQALKDYLEHRIGFPSPASEPAALKAYAAKTESLQMVIWKLAQAEGQRDRTAVTALFISTVNEMIDLATERTFSATDHVPELAYYVIFLITVASLYCLAYVYGYNRYRWTAPVLLAVLLSIVFILILDIDRPARGIIRVNSQLMQDLYDNLSSRTF